jgi:hypothetical protein
MKETGWSAIAQAVLSLKGAFEPKSSLGEKTTPYVGTADNSAREKARQPHHAPSSILLTIRREGLISRLRQRPSGGASGSFGRSQQFPEGTTVAFGKLTWLASTHAKPGDSHPPGLTLFRTARHKPVTTTPERPDLQATLSSVGPSSGRLVPGHGLFDGLQATPGARSGHALAEFSSPSTPSAQR